MWDAHRVTDTSNEAFVLRLFRQRNRTGFVKAITEQPETLQSGFAKVERVMKALFVTRLWLWPRFHNSVKRSLDSPALDLIEFRIPQNQGMRAVPPAPAPAGACSAEKAGESGMRALRSADERYESAAVGGRDVSTLNATMLRSGPRAHATPREAGAAWPLCARTAAVDARYFVNLSAVDARYVL